MNALAPLPTQSAAIRAMVPQTMTEVFQLAEAVHRSGLSPDGLGNVQAVAIAIMHGLELGVPPMTALQRIAIINGRPTIWGDLAIALVRASGLAESIREEIVGTGDDRIAICTVKRKGEPQPIVGTFSVDDAKRARLWDTREKVQRRSRNGNGTYEALNDAPWHRFPERMMKFRARGFALRDGFADVLGGLYLREEMEGEQAEARDVTPAPVPPAPPPASADRKEASAPPAPAALAPPAPGDTPPSPLDKISSPAVREMVVNNPSEPAELGRKVSASPPPPAAGAPVRTERPSRLSEGASSPEDAPSAEPTDLPPHLTALRKALGECGNETALENTWVFEEDDINTWSMTDRELAAMLYGQRLAVLRGEG